MRGFMVAVFSVVAVASALAQVDANRVVAVINGTEIRGSEYYRRMEFLPGVGKRIGQAVAEAAPGFLTLEMLITEKLVLQLAKEKGVAPSEAEIDEEIKFALEVDPDVLKAWLANGQSEAEFREQTRFNLSQLKLLTRGVNVTDTEVAEFYKNNRSLFTKPRMVQLRVIAVQNDEQARAVDADLAAGKVFADVAKERSLHPSNVNGGDLGKAPFTNLSESLRKELEQIRVGQTTGWVIGNNIRSKVQMVAVEPEVVAPLDEKLKRKVRRELSMTKGNIRNGETVRNEMREARRQAKVDIKQKEFADAYNRFVESFLGNNNVTAPANSGGTVGGGIGG